MKHPSGVADFRKALRRQPQTKDEKRMLKLIYQIHAGCNLQGWMIPSEEVLRKVQKLINEEREKWEI